MKIYNFDEVTDRTGTLSYKWEGILIEFPEAPDALPFWIADMEFPSPEPIVEAMRKRAAHPIYGYSHESSDAASLTASWLWRRYGWRAAPESVIFAGGVVPGLIAMMQAVTEPGDRVIVQPPVYYPFFEMVEDNGREIAENPLVFDGSKWVMDYEGFEELAADPRTKLFLLCNPHNPVSRAYTREELERVGEICLRHQVLIASDEIHGDIVYPGSRHIPIASLSPELSGVTMTSFSFAKTFNTAGLQLSMGVITDPILRERVQRQLKNAQYLVNLFGAAALKAAYGNPECEKYLTQLISYLWGNYLYLESYLKKYIPKIHSQKPEATYLIWLDCRELGLSDKELKRLFLEQAGLAFDFGPMFGQGGAGYVRINIACPSSLLQQGLERMRKVCVKKI
ncbi:MAG: pyridoxal phosphate-dependent aminotransferase [Lachnospiraceae bacterium]|jgi:cystathionine beta-lyase|nr:pyridoxal phosphate-dependent aminotransferase [Lachnospiraceae bacterium]MCI8996888.1 pyridoxal phosphate-dependent aminotransferase [Lachnospiraceae bacterium]